MAVAGRGCGRGRDPGHGQTPVAVVTADAALPESLRHPLKFGYAASKGGFNKRGPLKEGEWKTMRVRDHFVFYWQFCLIVR